MESNAVKNKLFSIISHDLKNPVLAQQKTLQLLVDNYEKLPQDIVYEHCKELSKSSESLLDLLISLLDWSRIGVGKMKYEPIRMDLLSLVEDAVKPLQEQMQQKNIELNINVGKGIFVSLIDAFLKGDRPNLQNSFSDFGQLFFFIFILILRLRP